MKPKISSMGIAGLLAVLFSTFFAVAVAAAADAVQKFDWHKGDTWTYKTETGRVLTTAVVEVGNDLIKVANVRADGSYSSRMRTYSPDLTKTSIQGYADPQWPVWKFPLRAGDNWGGTFAIPHLSRPGVTVTYTVNSRAEEWEDVTVPAGTFRSLKIVALYRWLSSNGATSTGREEMWISPVVGKFVKQTHLDFEIAGSATELTLVSFKRAPRVPVGEADSIQK